MRPRILLGAAMACCTASIALGQAATPTFSAIDIEKPAPLVEFKNSRLTRISGGVEITLRPESPDAKPMLLAAEEILFTWPEEGGSTPSLITLEQNVRVDSPQGLITSARAELALAKNLLTFSGNVRGKSDQISDFEAEQIVYDLGTGDSKMVGLRATGINLSSAPEGGAPGASNFSRMDIDRAASVQFGGGQVKSMDGGVAITLHPSDGKSKALKMSASTVGFAWSANGQPSVIKMQNAVRVDGPQGDIRSDLADFDLAKKVLEFKNNVQGATEQIESFRTDTLTYNMESGETTMTNLTAQGLQIQTAQTEKPEEEGQSFSRMDIENAPEVSMAAGKLNWIRGGVNIIMHASKPDVEPLKLRAQELTFAYPEGTTSPERVLLKDKVSVDGQTTDIRSDAADLNMASNKLTFTGNVTGERPGLTGLTAQQIVYDLRTGNIKMEGARAKEVDRDALGPEKAAETPPNS